MNTVWIGLMNAVWIGVMIAFALVEMATTGLVAVWFVVGGLAGLIASVLRLKLLTQFGAFVLVSGAALLATRPLVRRYTRQNVVRTNADRALDMKGRVTEPVDSERGAVYVDGKEWSARTDSPEPLPVGTAVRINRIEGVRLYVSRADT